MLNNMRKETANLDGRLKDIDQNISHPNCLHHDHPIHSFHFQLIHFHNIAIEFAFSPSNKSVNQNCFVPERYASGDGDEGSIQDMGMGYLHGE